MRISDWSSDVCSSDLREQIVPHLFVRLREPLFPFGRARIDRLCRTAIAKIGRRVREIDAVRRHLNAAFPAARIEAAEHQGMENRSEGGRRILREGVLKRDRKSTRLNSSH